MIQPEYNIKFVGDRLHDGKVLYKMQVYDTNTKAVWNIQARFSNLRDIHKALEERFPKGELPDFPPKGWWYENEKPEFITKRKKQLENYYNTLFKTMSINKLPQLKEFIEFAKPKVPQAQIKKQQKTAPRPATVSVPDKNDKIFNDIYEKTIQKFINLRSEDIEPPNDNQTKKKKSQFQKIKVEGKSTILQGMKLPKNLAENYLQFWATCYFQEKKDNQEQFLKEVKSFNMGFDESRESVSGVITNRVIVIEQ